METCGLFFKCNITEEKTNTLEGHCSVDAWELNICPDLESHFIVFCFVLLTLGSLYDGNEDTTSRSPLSPKTSNWSNQEL